MSEQDKSPAKSEKTAGKGHATQSRKAAQAAGRKPLVGDRSPEARKAQKAKLNADRATARAGMAAGEERYLSARDRGPQRKIARDVIDARWNVGELMIPLMIVVLLFSTIKSEVMQLGLVILMWGLLIGIVVDAYIAGKRVTKKVAEKYGADRVEKGLRWYAAVRSTQMRQMRLPKPQLKRGTKLD